MVENKQCKSNYQKVILKQQLAQEKVEGERNSLEPFLSAATRVSKMQYEMTLQ